MILHFLALWIVIFLKKKTKYQELGHHVISFIILRLQHCVNDLCIALYFPFILITLQAFEQAIFVVCGANVKLQVYSSFFYCATTLCLTSGFWFTFKAFTRGLFLHFIDWATKKYSSLTANGLIRQYLIQSKIYCWTWWWILTWVQIWVNSLKSGFLDFIAKNSLHCLRLYSGRCF